MRFLLAFLFPTFYQHVRNNLAGDNWFVAVRGNHCNRHMKKGERWVAKTSALTQAFSVRPRGFQEAPGMALDVLIDHCRGNPPKLKVDYLNWDENHSLYEFLHSAKGQKQCFSFGRSQSCPPAIGQRRSTRGRSGHPCLPGSRSKRQETNHLVSLTHMYTHIEHTPHLCKMRTEVAMG